MQCSDLLDVIDERSGCMRLTCSSDDEMHYTKGRERRKQGLSMVEEWFGLQLLSTFEWSVFVVRGNYIIWPAKGYTGLKMDFTSTGFAKKRIWKWMGERWYLGWMKLTSTSSCSTNLLQSLSMEILKGYDLGFKMGLVLRNERFWSKCIDIVKGRRYKAILLYLCNSVS